MTDISVLPKEDKIFTSEVPDLYLFVCTGNTCRSPMAAALFNAFWSDRAIASSAGTAASGMPISENARLALIARGVTPTATNDFPSHISTQVSAQRIRAAARVYAISKRHQAALISAFPEYAEKIFALPTDIPDPFGGDVETYRRCLAQIEEALTLEFGEIPGGSK